MNKTVKKYVSIMKSVVGNNKKGRYDHGIFLKNAREALEKIGFKEIGKGCYCVAFGKGKYVVKISTESASKFDKEYSEKYLQPLHISENRLWVIQPMADYANWMDRKNIYTEKKKALKKKYEAEIKKLEEKEKKQAELVKKYSVQVDKFLSKPIRGLDVHRGNIGVYKDKVIFIDLDNHHAGKK